MAAQLITGLGGKCLDIRGGIDTSGTPIILFPIHGGNNQLWELLPSGEIISLLNPNKCLDIMGGNANDRTPIILWDRHGGQNQKWIYKNGIIQSALDPNKCIDVQGGVDTNGTPIILFTKHGGANQKWNFVSSTPLPPQKIYPIMAENNQLVQDKRWMNSKSDLSANGYLHIETYSKTNKDHYGLRGGVTVTCYDVAENLIFFSQEFRITTRCGRWDPVCDSEGINQFYQPLPATIGRDTNRIAIHHTVNSFHDVMKTWANTCKLIAEGGKVAADTAQDIMKYVAPFLA